MKKLKTKLQWIDAAYSFDLKRAGLVNENDANVMIERRGQSDGISLFVVTTGAMVLNKDLVFEFEPLPSSRDEDFIERTRFLTKEEAQDYYIRYAKKMGRVENKRKRTYILLVPKTLNVEPFVGEPTNFTEKILRGEKGTVLHDDYIWEDRIKRVQRGEAEISLRYWTGVPIRSEQAEFGRITKDDNPGFERLKIGGDYDPTNEVELKNSSFFFKNEGLTLAQGVALYGKKSKKMLLIYLDGRRYSYNDEGELIYSLQQ